MGTAQLICLIVFQSCLPDANVLFIWPRTLLQQQTFLNSCGVHVLSTFSDGILPWSDLLQNEASLDTYELFMDHLNTQNEGVSMAIISFG